MAALFRQSEISRHLERHHFTDSSNHTVGQHGVTLYFLPAYSPELNRIEQLWHKIKYTWMAVKCRTAKELAADVGEILDNFGATYKFDFYSR